LESERGPWGRAVGLVALLTLSLTAWPAFSQSQAPTASQSAPAPAPAKKPPPKPQKKVDINNATLSELRTLPLGEAEAKKVIAHRPYKARGELMTKAGLPEGVYFAVKDKVELQTPREAAPKK
jgi:competence protein ComEA